MQNSSRYALCSGRSSSSPSSAPTATSPAGIRATWSIEGSAIFSGARSVYRPRHRRMYRRLVAYNPVGIEISDMRKRLRAAIDQSRRAAAARRTELGEAAEAYERFLAGLAEPLVQMLANAMRAE